MPLLHAEHLDMLVWCNLDREDPEPRAVPVRLLCHPEAGLRLTYDGEQEALFMACATCGEARLAIAVARQPPPPTEANDEVDDDDFNL